MALFEMAIQVTRLHDRKVARQRKAEGFDDLADDDGIGGPVIDGDDPVYALFQDEPDRPVMDALIEGELVVARDLQGLRGIRVCGGVVGPAR